MTTTKTTLDDMILQAMLSQTQYSQPAQEEEFWFSRGNQKKMVFDLGAKLLVSEEMTPQEAIEMAQEYVDTFYSTTMSPQGWKKE